MGFSLFLIKLFFFYILKISKNKNDNSEDFINKVPHNDETSETTELNLINTFSYIYDFLHFKASFFSLQNHLVNNKNTNSEEKIKEPVASKTFCNISFNINSSRFYF